jgi:hypothetical protein
VKRATIVTGNEAQFRQIVHRNFQRAEKIRPFPGRKDLSEKPQKDQKEGFIATRTNKKPDSTQMYLNAARGRKSFICSRRKEKQRT